MRYSLVLEFESDDSLTKPETDLLLTSIVAQVEDPTPLRDDERRARYSTKIVRCILESTESIDAEGVPLS